MSVCGLIAFLSGCLARIRTLTKRFRNSRATVTLRGKKAVGKGEPKSIPGVGASGGSRRTECHAGPRVVSVPSRAASTASVFPEAATSWRAFSAISSIMASSWMGS